MDDLLSEHDMKLIVICMGATVLLLGAYTLGKRAHRAMVPTVPTSPDWIRREYARRVIPGNVQYDADAAAAKAFLPGRGGGGYTLDGPEGNGPVCK